MFSRLMVALIAVRKRSKLLFGRKRLPGPEFYSHMTKDNMQPSERKRLTTLIYSI